MKLYAGLNFEGASGFPLQMHNTVGCSRSVNFAGNKHGWERRGGEAARGVCCSHRGAVLIVTMEEKGKTMATGASLKWSIDPKTPLCTLPSIKWSTVSCMYNLYARAAPLSLSLFAAQLEINILVVYIYSRLDGESSLGADQWTLWCSLHTSSIIPLKLFFISARAAISQRFTTQRDSCNSQLETGRSPGRICSHSTSEYKWAAWLPVVLFMSDRTSKFTFFPFLSPLLLLEERACHRLVWTTTTFPSPILLLLLLFFPSISNVDDTLLCL